MMKHLITMGVITAIVVALALFNRNFDTPRVTAAETEAAEEAVEMLAKAEAAGEETDTVEAPEKVEPPKAEPEATAPAATEASATPAEVAEEWPAVAPDVFRLKFEASNGDFVIECHKDWAPLGVERFYQLCKEGVYSEARFFRVVPDFVVQFGIPGDPAVARQWREANIKDDPVKQTNAPGYVSFATAGPNTRTSQVFINLGNNRNLDGMGFAPFGQVVEGFDVVKKITSEYGQRPDQGKIQSQGNAYLKPTYPNMDYIKSVSLLK